MAIDLVEELKNKGYGPHSRINIQIILGVLREFERESRKKFEEYDLRERLREPPASGWFRGKHMYEVREALILLKEHRRIRQIGEEKYEIVSLEI